MKSLAILLLTLLITLFFTLVYGLESTLAATPDSVKIGVIIPLTGNTAPLGEDCRQGIQLASEVAPNSNSVEFVFGDSLDDPKQGVTEFRRLTEAEKVLGIIEFRGPVGMAINPLSLQKGVPLLGGVANVRFAEDNRYAFQLWPTSDDEARLYSQHLIDRGLLTVGLISLQDDYMSSVAEAFRRDYQKLSGKILLDEEVAATESDFLSIVSRLKHASPAVILLNSSISHDAQLLKRIREQGLTQPVVANFYVSKPEALKIAGESAEGVQFLEIASDPYVKLKRRLEEKFKVKRPSGATLSCYSGAALLFQTIENAQTKLATPEELYQALIAEKAIKLEDLDLTVTKRRVQFPMAFKVIRGGAVVEGGLDNVKHPG